MYILLRVLGTLCDAIAGPATSWRVQTVKDSDTYRLVPDLLEPGETAYVESRRVSYRYAHERWWIPDLTFHVYEVTGHYDGPYKDVLGPFFDAKEVYPSMHAWLLHGSDYPHLTAIHTFLGRMSHVDPRMGLQA